MKKPKHQSDLFGSASTSPAKGYEVHEHCIISGPRHSGRLDRNRIVHSHEGGDVYHSHPHTGPASFVIDKDEWFAATGLRGGGRKKFTKTPNDEQLPYIARKLGEGEFEIHVGPPPPGWTGSGGGYAAACRMIMAGDNKVSKVIPFGPKGRAKAAGAA